MRTAVTLPSLLSMPFKPVRKMILDFLIADCDREVSGIDAEVIGLYNERRKKIQRQIRLVEKRNALERRQ